MRRWLLIVMILGLFTPAQSRLAQTQCFSETGFCVEGRIAEYWLAHGGLAVFGYPLNNARLERNRDTQQVYITQWFERTRFEWHSNERAPYDILLGRIGAEKYATPLPTPGDTTQSSCEWFEATQLNVCNQAGTLGFLSFWHGHGLQFDGQSGFSYAESLALFGYPISHAEMNTNSSGDTLLTQWFERARLEWHPANPDQFKVLLGRLGSEQFDPYRANGTVAYTTILHSGWGGSLVVPEGFMLNEVASNLAGPRFMAVDPGDHSLVVAEFHSNTIQRLRDSNADGVYNQKQLVAGGFTVMHSVAYTASVILPLMDALKVFKKFSICLLGPQIYMGIKPARSKLGQMANCIFQ